MRTQVSSSSCGGRRGATLLALTASLCADIGLAQSPSLKTIYNFPGGSVSGGLPEARLTLGPSGSLFGTTQGGESPGIGSIFRLIPPAGSGEPWAENVLETLVPSPTAVTPEGGSLYGASSTGGNVGAGTINMLSPPSTDGSPWTATTVYSFVGGSDGLEPSQPIFVSGNLFGTTILGGGTTNAGTIYELIPPTDGSTSWTEAILHRFTGAPSDGEDPNGPLAAGPGGILYGTTAVGGTSNVGTAFSLSPPAQPGGEWTETIINNFPPASAQPSVALTLGKNGTLYGTSGAMESEHNGTVFALFPPSQPGGAWTLHTLHSFSGEPDGSRPEGQLVIGANGALFGTTYKGGASNKGCVFELSPPSEAGGAWTETILHSFSGPDGRDPLSGLTLGSNGVLFGTASAGGTSGNGTVFELVP